MAFMAMVLYAVLTFRIWRLESEASALRSRIEDLERPTLDVHTITRQQIRDAAEYIEERE